jgi:6-phosphofructokinase 2
MKIATITLNPSLDKSTYTERLIPDKKLYCAPPIYEPGGGGINVSRAIHLLDGQSLAIYLAGGEVGDKIQELLDKEGIHQKCIRTKNATRENLMVTERSTGNQYRLGMPGNEKSKEELQECLDIIKDLPEQVEYLVASGSLPPGAPDDFYRKIAEISSAKGIKFILDTSGKGLLSAAGAGIYLMKPNLRELSQIIGKELVNGLEQEAIARKVIQEGKANILVVSLGPKGAMLATKDIIQYVVPPSVKPISTVGAGDSMVAGIVLSLSRGYELRGAIKFGVAAGTAATMTPGTELCRKKDVEEIYSWLSNHEDR